MKFCVLALCFLSVWTDPSLAKPKNARIIGGAVARAGQFPYAAAIYKLTAQGNYFCGGAILENDFIITAGQCVDGATSFIIYVGANSLTGDEPNRLELATEKFFLHPDYNPNTLENDIGLIQLRSWISFTDYIKSISYLSTTALPDSSTVLTFGWGQTSDSTPGPVASLIYAYFVTLSNAECRLTYGSAITDNMVCIGGSFNQGTCEGDGGNPLIQNSAAGQTYLVGVSSFYSANGCESLDPSGFTRIVPYTDWINNVTRSN